MQSRTHEAEAVPNTPWSVSARDGSADQAWRALTEELSGAPVLGPSGHGLTCGPPAESTTVPTTTVIGGLTVAGCSWVLLERLTPPEHASEPPPGWAAGVAEIRLGLSLWLRERAVTRLRERKTGGTALVHQQLVRSDLAWAATEQAMAQSLLTGPKETPDAVAVLGRAGRHVTAADRCLLRLFGASGFLSDGPGQVVRLSELMGDAYLEPVTVDMEGSHSDRAG